MAAFSNVLDAQLDDNATVLDCANANCVHDDCTDREPTRQRVRRVQPAPLDFRDQVFYYIVVFTKMLERQEPSRANLLAFLLVIAVLGVAWCRSAVWGVALSALPWAWATYWVCRLPRWRTLRDWLNTVAASYVLIASLMVVLWSLHLMAWLGYTLLEHGVRGVWRSV